jgi:perosamine synthetase
MGRDRIVTEDGRVLRNTIFESLLEETPAAAGGTPVREFPLRHRVTLDSEAIRDVRDLLSSGVLSAWKGGPVTRRFESEFAAYHGASAAVAVNSGTSALHCAYLAAGLRADDEIVVPAASYVSAASAAAQIGARVVVCDIDSETLSMAPDSLLSCITARTRVIVPVHLWGIPSAMPLICEIAAERGITVVEDCAQAHGASLDDQLVGTFGDFAAFSFSPEKMICTGQGGIVLCREAGTQERLRQLASKGKGSGWHDYIELGYSYVMPEFEAIAGLSGLRQLPYAIAAAARAVAVYQDAFVGTELQVVKAPPGAKPSYFKCAVRLPERMSHLRDDIHIAIAAENVRVRLTHPPLDTIAWLTNAMVEHQRGRPAGNLCPVANRELPLVLELESSLSEEDAWRSAAGVLRAFNRIGRPLPKAW